MQLTHARVLKYNLNHYYNYSIYLPEFTTYQMLFQRSNRYLFFTRMVRAEQFKSGAAKNHSNLYKYYVEFVLIIRHSTDTRSKILQI
jgi:hypothetical protein